MINDTAAKPTTHQADLAKLPRALAPLIERPQWAVWRWTQQADGTWQKPPFMATRPQRHASTKDPSTWSDYATALAAVQAGKADGICYILTEDDPFAAIDLDHCRHVDTHSIDIWAQLFLEFGRHTYSEVTPSGAGCRIWGLANGVPLQRKFTLEIDGKEIAAELFRRTRKALTITGYRLDTIHELTNIDKVIDWGVIWGERRKAAAAEAAARSTAIPSTAMAAAIAIDQIEQIVRNGAPAGANRSDVFHTVVGHYLGCGWTPSKSWRTCSNSRRASASVTCARTGCTERSPGALANMRLPSCRCLPGGSTAGRPRHRCSRSPKCSRVTIPSLRSR